MSNPAGSADIGPTYIGTGNQPISLCDPGSLPYFPAIGSLRFGRQIQGTIFEDTFSAAALRGSFGASYSFFMGLCGPAVALAMTWEGRLQNSGSTMTLSNDEAQAGFIFGMSFGLSLDFNVALLTPTVVWDGWQTHIRSTWTNLLNLSPSFSFDIISIIVDLLARIAGGRGEALDNQRLQRVGTALEGLGTARPWGIFDDAGDLFSAGGRGGRASLSAQVRPQIPIQVNIVPAVPALAAAAKALNKVQIDLTVGPVFNIGFPVDLTLNSLRFSSNGGAPRVYPLTAGTQEGVYTMTGPAVQANITDMSVNLSYTPGIRIGLAFSASLSVLSFLSVGATIDFPFAIGFPIAGRTTVNLSNSIGSTTLAAQLQGCGCGEEIGELLDVEFAPITA